MPCRSDYLERSGQELESKRVCQNLMYLQGQLGFAIPAWVSKAADEYYGNLNRLDEATQMLCGLCRQLTTEEKERYIYDAHSKEARGLAGWWERHQEWDARRVAEEEDARKLAVTKERAIQKLTPDELKALGLI